MSTDAQDARAVISRVKRWYHAIEVAPGVVTDALFDLRPILARMPWPDVRGKRCLDVGTSDGFLAFELERRGAAEVVATDIASHGQWDWEAHMHEVGPRYLRHVSGPEMGDGFRVAHELLRSRVSPAQISVYDLSPERMGTFEVVVCGSLLLHLRDPLRALTAIRSVCTGEFLCTNQIDLVRSALVRRRPLIRLDGTSGITQWWLPNAAGHRQMVRAAGFTIERESPLYAIPYGPVHPTARRRPQAQAQARSILTRILAGNDGVPHFAVLARPA
jgi:tRNA (mo5U34)-methyltransferase